MKNRLELIRIHYHLNQVELGEAMGVSKQTVHNYMTGRNNPKKERLEELCKNFPEINLRWVRFGEGEMLKDKKTDNILNNSTQSVQVMVDIGEVLKTYFNNIDAIKEILNNTAKLLSDAQNSYKKTIESLEK
jgi:DNA-binding XRE family transcriptional regulator